MASAWRTEPRCFRLLPAADRVVMERREGEFRDEVQHREASCIRLMPNQKRCCHTGLRSFFRRRAGSNRRFEGRGAECEGDRPRLGPVAGDDQPGAAAQRAGERGLSTDHRRGVVSTEAAATGSDPALAGYVTDRLALGWTPEQLAGRLKRGVGRGRRYVSTETIPLEDPGPGSSGPARSRANSGVGCRTARQGGGGGGLATARTRSPTRSMSQSDRRAPTAVSSPATGRPTS